MSKANQVLLRIMVDIFNKELGYKLKNNLELNMPREVKWKYHSLILVHTLMQCGHLVGLANVATQYQ